MSAALRLYRVEATVEFYVVAKDDGEADLVADRYLTDAVRDRRADYYPDEVTDTKWMSPRDLKAIPYGDNPKDLTVAEFLTPEHAPPDESKGPVVWCHRCRSERVQWEWRVEEQVCRECREEEKEAA